jgi:ATP-dependent DNA helicase DinG
MSGAAGVLGVDGPIAKTIAGYEPRPGQVQMAAAIEAALATQKHLAIEAPCGVGKSFAYLVPAIRHAIDTESKVVVCTANIALQEQLMEKDLPVLSRALGGGFTYALIKGIGNYLCLDRFEDAKSDVQELVFSPPEVAAWKRLVAWTAGTKSGDVSDLPFTPPDAVWNRVNGVSELCNGADCPEFEDCFAMTARRRLRAATVIVCNYHLFFAHLAVKIAAERDVLLPAHSAVICDEAHDMADIARDFFGARFTPYSTNMLLRGANVLHLRRVGNHLKTESNEFFRRVSDYKRSGRYKNRLREKHFADAADLKRTVSEYRDALGEARHAASDDATADKCAKFDGAAARYVDTLDMFLELDDPNLVCWIDEDARATRLVARVIDPSPVLREHLFGQTQSVIMTSATLATKGDFAFVKRETGGETADERIVPSPFNYREQAVLVVPRVEASPNDPAFAKEIAPHINRIVERLGGRTLALFTSYKNLQVCADAAKSTGVEILRQGDAPRSKLLEEFRKDRGTALFATSSFWQGVDVPGEALSCLVIDKIPFENPDDPLVAALQERDKQSFQNWSLPRATMLLRQGFGRLIRSKTDRGAVVIFDNRLFTARYGRDILASLPDVEVFRDLFALERMFPKK